MSMNAFFRGREYTDPAKLHSAVSSLFGSAPEWVYGGTVTVYDDNGDSYYVDVDGVCVDALDGDYGYIYTVV